MRKLVRLFFKLPSCPDWGQSAFRLCSAFRGDNFIFYPTAALASLVPCLPTARTPPLGRRSLIRSCVAYCALRLCPDPTGSAAGSFHVTLSRGQKFRIASMTLKLMSNALNVQLYRSKNLEQLLDTSYSQLRLTR